LLCFCKTGTTGKKSVTESLSSTFLKEKHVLWLVGNKKEKKFHFKQTRKKKKKITMNNGNMVVFFF